MAKIRMISSQGGTVEEAFSSFLLSAKARGIKDKTLATYTQHIHSISKRLDVSVPIKDLKNEDLENMIVRMREEDLSDTIVLFLILTYDRHFIYLVFILLDLLFYCFDRKIVFAVLVFARERIIVGNIALISLRSLQTFRIQLLSLPQLFLGKTECPALLLINTLAAQKCPDLPQQIADELKETCINYVFVVYYSRKIKYF